MNDPGLDVPIQDASNNVDEEPFALDATNEHEAQRGYLDPT